jgi:hypothetical protein
MKTGMAIKIGELLMKAELITQKQLEEALVAQRTFGGKLGTNLVELGYISEQALADFLSKQLNFPPAKPKDFDAIPKDVINLVSKDFAKNHRMIPIRMEKQRIIVAAADPNDLAAVDELKFKVGKPVQPIIAPEIWVTAAMERYYNIPRNVRFVSLEDEPTQPGVGISSIPRFQQPERDLPQIGGVISEDTNLALEAFVDRLLKVKTKDDVFAALLEILRPFYPRVAIYMVRQELICGWVVRGFAMHDRDFQKIQVPFKERSTIHEVLDKKAPYVGPNPVSQSDLRLTYNLWIPANAMVEIRPIIFRGKGVAVVLGVPEQESEGTAIRRNEILQMVFEKAGYALEMGALRRTIAEIRL